MINTIVVDYEPQSLSLIERQLKDFCPQLMLSGVAKCSSGACRLIETLAPELAIIAVEMPRFNGFQILKNFSLTNLEIIFVSHSSDFAVEAVRHQVSGFVLKPVDLDDLLQAVNTAKLRIEAKQLKLSNKNIDQAINKHPHGNLIGVPSLKGFDFIQIQDIIRCESLLKCTRIVTKDRADILSSYNIGEFSKQLESFGFFSTHKSHLINLSKVKEYYKEGTVKMTDNSFVPVSKRKKSQFLNQMLLSR